MPQIIQSPMELYWDEYFGADLWRKMWAHPDEDYSKVGWKMEYLPPVVCNPGSSVIVEMREGVPEGLHG